MKMGVRRLQIETTTTNETEHENRDSATEIDKTQAITSAEQGFGRAYADALSEYIQRIEDNTPSLGTKLEDLLNRPIDLGDLSQEMSSAVDDETGLLSEDKKPREEMGKFLALNLVILTWRYNQLVEQYNKRCESFEREITRLREALEKSQRARTRTFQLPEEWAIEDDE
jgi:adenylosuccinate synthase